jgi:primase-polymerase (primpol)-like protein
MSTVINRILCPDVASIRANLTELLMVRQWVLWKAIEKPGKTKLDKPPYQAWANKQALASVANPDTWAYFGDAVAVYKRLPHVYAGVGFVLTKDDPFVFIDLDNCRDPRTGTVEDWALDIVREFGSYTELSPSGTGLHILTRGTLARAVKKPNIEMYSAGRYATVTGHVFEVPR